MEVAAQTVVSLRYRMKNGRGDVLEDRLNTTPVEYLHGGGGILQVLEASLLGLRPGDARQVVVSAETSSQLNSSYYFDVVIDAVRAATDEEIAKGKPAKKETKDECGPGCVC